MNGVSSSSPPLVSISLAASSTGSGVNLQFNLGLSRVIKKNLEMNDSSNNC
jgi:hypothetical protein